jgi:hypothetical protein
MKKILLVLCLNLLVVSGYAYTNVNLRVDTNGNLVAPTNFFRANSVRVSAVLTNKQDLIGATAPISIADGTNVVMSQSSAGTDGWVTATDWVSWYAKIGVAELEVTSNHFQNTKLDATNGTATGLTVSNLTNNGWMALGTNGTYQATINTNTVITNIVSGGWVVITPDGKMGIGKVPTTGYGLDLVGNLFSSASIVANLALTVGAGNSIAFNGRSKMYSLGDGYVSFVNNSGTDLIRTVFGTNSVTGTNFAAISVTNKPSGGTPDIAFTGQSGATKANIWAQDAGFTGSILMQTNSAIPSPIINGVWFWNSNNVIWCISNTKTNLLIDMR